MFTALLIASLVVAGAATAVGGILVWASGRKQLAAGGSGALPQLGPATERTPADLREGDIVQHDGRDFLIEGCLRYDEDGHRWAAHRLIDAPDERWLVVGMERIGSASLRLCAIDKTVEMSGFPPDIVLAHGERYKLDKRGTASVQSSGETGVIGKDAAAGAAGGVMRCRWWRYEAPGEKCLIVEQWGAEFRVLAGKTIAATDLELMPGS